MWSNFKSIFKDNKTKCVIIEDGEPKYVVLTFLEYQHLQGIDGGGILEPERSRKAGENSSHQEPSGDDRRREWKQDDYSSPINIEDLPF